MPVIPITYQPWDQFFDGFETGDVILMNGLFKSSIFIEAATHCHWSHVAVIAISDDLGITSLPSGTVLLWESNLKNPDNKNNLVVTDVLLGEQKDGPILDNLKERITNNFALGYDADVAKRKLSFKKTPEIFAEFNTVIANVHSGTFPSIPYGEMGNYLMGLTLQKPVTDNTFFCSQLFAHTYNNAFGLLDKKYVDNSYAPANFSVGEYDTTLLQGATLGPEIWLDKNTIPAYPGY